MKTYILNIGLMDLNMSVGEIVGHIYMAMGKPLILKYRVDTSMMDGHEVQILVVKVSTPIPEQSVYTIMEILAETLDQNCIAISNEEGWGALIYNHYYEGLRKKFRYDLFKYYNIISAQAV